MSSLARAFSIDYRSLRLTRAAMGFVLIFHVLHLIYDRVELFTDEGFVTTELVTYNGAIPWIFSLFHFSGEPWMAWLHFFLLSGCALGLLFNYFPRLSSFIAYALILSLNNRITYAIFGVDTLLAMILFWLSFLPPGPAEGGGRKYFTSFASVAVLLQIAVLYSIAGFMKSFDYWFTNGYAVYIALQAELYARPLGTWLATNLPYPVLQFASAAVLIWERFGPLLFFSPFMFTWCRGLAFLGFAGMHLGFALTMAIGLFPGADIAFLFLLIPTAWWDALASFEPLKHLPELKTFKRTEAPMDVWTPVVIAAFFCVAVWNLKRLNFRIVVPGPVKWAAKHMSLNQNWGMFAPSPFVGDGWYVIQGETVSGRAVDVLREKDGWADFRKPSKVSTIFPSERWISNSISMIQREHEANRHVFAEYLCRRWKKSGREPLREVRVWFVAESTVMKGQYQPVFSRMIINKLCL